MKTNNEIKIFQTTEDMKEIEDEYKKCLTIENNGDIRFPSLKYAFYNMNLKKAFLKKIKLLKTNVETIQKSLTNNNKISVDSIKGMEQLNDIKDKLIKFEKEAIDNYEYNCDYLVTLAKRRDTLKTPIADKIYVSASEDIIQSIIKYYINIEKNLILFNDNLNSLTQKFHI